MTFIHNGIMSRPNSRKRNATKEETNKDIQNVPINNPTADMDNKYSRRPVDTNIPIHTLCSSLPFVWVVRSL